MVTAEAPVEEHLEDVAAEGAKSSAAVVQDVAPAPQASGADEPTYEEQDECAAADRTVDMVARVSASVPHPSLPAGTEETRWTRTRPSRQSSPPTPPKTRRSSSSAGGWRRTVASTPRPSPNTPTRL